MRGADIYSIDQCWSSVDHDHSSVVTQGWGATIGPMLGARLAHLPIHCTRHQLTSVLTTKQPSHVSVQNWRNRTDTDIFVISDYILLMHSDFKERINAFAFKANDLKTVSNSQQPPELTQHLRHLVWPAH